MRMNGGGEKTWKGEEKHSGRPVCRERGEVQPRWWNVRKRKCHCHASTRRPRRRSGGLLFMKEAIEEGKEKKRDEEEEESTGHMALCIYIYIYNVVNCQRYYGLCPVSDQQNLLSLLLAPSQFFSPLVASLEAANPLPR